MKKVLLLFLMLMAFLPAGCGNGADDRDQPSSSGKGPSVPSATPSTNLKDPPDEAQIIRDLNAFSLDALEESGARVTECEIVKRQSNTEKKEDIVFCKVTGEGDFSRMEYQFRLLYNYYDVGGWILDEVEPEKEDEWSLAYLDAEGNDILDDMIWLDGFTPASLTGAEYYGTAGDMTYIGINYYQSGRYSWNPYEPLDLPEGSAAPAPPDSYISIWNVYDQNGNQVLPEGTIRSTEDTSCNIGDVYLSSDGKLRFTYSLYNGNVHISYLIDENGTILNRDVSEGISIVGQKSNSDLLIVRRETGRRPDGTTASLYGAIDLDGNIVIPIEYENRSDVDPDYVIPSLPADFQWIELPEFLQKKGFGDIIYNINMNGVFAQGLNKGYDFVDVAGQTIADVPCDYKKIDNRNNMIIVFRGDTIRLYDLDGHTRSPEFLLLNTRELVMSNTSLYIVNYNGRCGILPQITTNEESRYFRYYWGSERFGSG